MSDDAQRPPPLYVDLDDTLIRGDLLWEALLELAGQRPAELLQVPRWLLGGRARLKWELARRVRLDAAALPYRPGVTEFLAQERQTGRRIVLATAAPEPFAREVASHLRVFDDTLASDADRNLDGVRKLAAIRRHSDGGAFDYLGRSRADEPIWAAAREALCVAAGSEAVERLDGRRRAPRAARAVWRALRPHQWSKNLLVGVPVVMGHALDEPARVLASALAFLFFCMVASATYLLNDLFDLRADRLHPSKRRRPLAAGELSARSAVLLAGGLYGAGMLGALGLLPLAFTALLAGYVAITLAYTFVLKRLLLLDVICLAELYAHRVMAGAAAAAIVVSPWLLGFSVFFFLSLALAKRYVELGAAVASDGSLAGRAYLDGDRPILLAAGLSSGYLAVLVQALYLQGTEVVQLYAAPVWLWGIAPVLLYWITRVWFLAGRGSLHDDPVAFALRDRTSWACAAGIGAFLLLATRGPG